MSRKNSGSFTLRKVVCVPVLCICIHVNTGKHVFLVFISPCRKPFLHSLRHMPCGNDWEKQQTQSAADCIYTSTGITASILLIKYLTLSLLSHYRSYCKCTPYSSTCRKHSVVNIEYRVRTGERKGCLSMENGVTDRNCILKGKTNTVLQPKSR
jgi:hypothetical protein